MSQLPVTVVTGKAVLQIALVYCTLSCKESHSCMSRVQSSWLFNQVLEICLVFLKTCMIAFQLHFQTLANQARNVPCSVS